MILYYVASQYQLLQALVHKNKYHKDCDAVLTGRAIGLSLINKIKQLNYFVDIIEFPYIRFIDDYKKRIEKEYLPLLPCAFEKMDKVYLMASQDAFTFYFLDKHIHFSTFEEASGIFTHCDALRNNIRLINVEQDEMLNTHGIYDATNPLIDNIYCDFNSQVEGFFFDKAIDFNIMRELQSLNDIRNDIINLFVSDIDSFPKSEDNSCFLLTQHFANLNIMSWKEQEEIYKVFCDYFLYDYNKIIIKPHPSDNMYYDLLLPNAAMIKEKFPSEFLPFIYSDSPVCVSAVSSTSINLLSPYFNQSICLDNFFERHFHITHKYYTAIIAIKELLENGCTLHTYAADCTLLNALIKKYINYNAECVMHYNIKELESLDSNSIVFIDDIKALPDDLIALSEDICRIADSSNSKLWLFINSAKQYIFYNYNYKNLWTNISPIEIAKKSNANVEIDTIYLYTKGEREKMNVLNKELPNSDAEICASEFQGDKLQIKVLEGILAATEERLRFYIEKADEKEGK